MERLLFRKVAAWVLVLAFAVFLMVLVGFGFVLRAELKNPDKYDMIGDIALNIAKIPQTIKDLIHNKNPMVAERTARLDGKSGWNVLQPAEGGRSEGYLLLSRYSGDAHSAVIELVDLTDLSVHHVWQPDADVLLSDAVLESAITERSRWNTALFRAAHPLLLPDASLILKDHETPLMRVDACANMLWREESDIYHHSTNIDADGNIWVPTRIEPSSRASTERYNDDALAEVSPEGQLLQTISLTDIFVDNGLRPLIFGAGAFMADTFHLNDIEPVLADGPYWKKGDLFVSMRHKSMIMLYRPSTGKIIWSQQGPWMAQHDVDVIDDHTIAVFDNRAYDMGQGWYVDGTNDIKFYDFRTGITTSPYEEVLREADVVTLTEGLFDKTDSGRVIVEEENSGRLLIIGRDGRLAAEYVNRAGDGKVYAMGWSRWITRDLGDAALAAIASGGACDR